MVKTVQRSTIKALAFACASAMVLVAHADEGAHKDEVVLKDGSRVVGTVKSLRDGELVIATDFAGDLTINLDKVATLNSDTPASMLMENESVVQTQALTIAQDQVIASSDSGETRGYALDSLKIVNPEPWELGEGYKWSGLANFALKLERGNTVTDEIDYKLDTQWQSTQDRYSIEFNGERDEANDIKSADNWLGRLKYDYFFDGPIYAGMSASAESDEFNDIDLRYVIGPHIGRQFYTLPRFSLEAEVGLAYTNEDFIVSEDQEYAAGTWRVKMSSNYLGGDSRLYVDQRGVWNLESTSDAIIDTTFGLAFPLLWNLEAAAEILWEYDSGAVEGVDDLDETYSLRLGYTW